MLVVPELIIQVFVNRVFVVHVLDILQLDTFCATPLHVIKRVPVFVVQVNVTQVLVIITPVLVTHELVVHVFVIPVLVAIHIMLDTGTSVPLSYSTSYPSTT